MTRLARRCLSCSPRVRNAQTTLCWAIAHLDLADEKAIAVPTLNLKTDRRFEEAGDRASADLSVCSVLGCSGRSQISCFR